MIDEKPRCSDAALDGVRVIGIGSYVPERDRDERRSARQFGFDPEWIVQRTGIRERRHAPPEMATSDLAVAAAQQCIERAGVAKPRHRSDRWSARSRPTCRFPPPPASCRTSWAFCAPAVDLQAACAGFMYALVTGDAIRRHRLQQAGPGDRGRLQFADRRSARTRKPIRCSATAPGPCCWRPAARPRVHLLHAGRRRLGRRAAQRPMGGSRLPANAERLGTADAVSADGRQAGLQMGRAAVGRQHHGRAGRGENECRATSTWSCCTRPTSGSSMPRPTSWESTAKDAAQSRSLRQYVGRQHSFGPRRRFSTRPHPSRQQSVAQRLRRRAGLGHGLVSLVSRKPARRWSCHGGRATA